jgi:hypothetical protein
MSGRGSHVLSLVCAIAAITCLLVSSPAPAAQWYVSPTGTAANAGTLASPWSLDYALTAETNPVTAGDTIWLLAGDYHPANGGLLVQREGNPSAQTIIRNYQNGQATIHGTIYLYGSVFPPQYLTFQGLELVNDDANGGAVAGGFAVGASTGSDPGIKIVDCVVHDCKGHGISSETSVSDFEAYGNLFYFNGSDPNFGLSDGLNVRSLAPLGAGHGQSYVNNFVFRNMGAGTHMTAGPGEYVTYDGDIFFNNGEISGPGMNTEIAINPSDGNHASGQTLTNLCTYIPAGAATGGLVTMDDTVNATISNGYFISAPSPFTLGFFNISLAMTNNTILGGISNFAINDYGTGNTNPAVPTSGKKIVVEPDKYEAGRANIAIYNYDQSSSVSVNVSSAGLVSGWSYEVRDAQNYFGAAVTSGTYTGAPISIPMTTEFPAMPLALVNPPLSTCPAFGSFVIRAVNNAPVVTVAANQTVTLPVNSATISGTTSDDGLPAGHAVTTAWTQVSGPAAATITNASALSTTVTCPNAGTYTFRLTASDSALTGYGDQSITVVDLNAKRLMQLSFSEGTGLTAFDSSGSGNNGTRTAVGAAPLPTWTTTGPTGFGGAMQFDSNGTHVDYVGVPSFPLTNPATGTNTDFTIAFWFNPGNSIDANHSSYHYMFSWGGLSTANSINVWLTCASETPSGIGIRTLASDSAGTHLSNDPPWQAPTPGDTLDVYDTYTAGTGTYATYHFADGNWHHYALTFSATTGRTVYIDGNALITDMKDVGHSVVPNTSKLYIGCRCDTNNVRNYGGQMDEVIVISHALDANNVLALMQVQNLAPTANAGPNKKIMLCTTPLINSVALAGTISDDGQPNPPATCTAAWSKLSGPPAAVTFANPAAASTTATFTSAGTYVLQLTANDSVLTGTSNVTVIILAPGDFNGDGRVDGVDFLNWQSHYPTTSGGTCDHGDANGDGKVDGVDFLIWQSHYHG